MLLLSDEQDSSEGRDLPSPTLRLTRPISLMSGLEGCWPFTAGWD
jgi:hypothetical protein